MKRGQGTPETGNPEPLAGDLMAVAGMKTRRRNPLSEMHAAPCAPGPELGTRPAHPAGEMLEVAHRIAQIATVSRSAVGNDPYQRGIGSRMLIPNGIIRRKIRHPRLVELQDRLSRFSGNPLGLGIAQRVPIKRRATLPAVAAGDRVIVDFFHVREPRAGIIHGRDFRFPAMSRRAKSMRGP